MKEKILVVAAHPDDEVLGCSGTIAKRIREGSSASTLILGEGVTSRDGERKREERKKDIEKLRKNARRANSIIGIKDIALFDFPDNRFDTVALLDIVKIVERTIKDVKPNVIFTHHYNDLNIDHRVTFNAVMTACRPSKGQLVRQIYSFDVPSSTDWNYPSTFNPNVFVDIRSTINKKIRAMSCYKSEMRPFPHPRSPEAIRTFGKYWGTRVGLICAEAFEAVRIIK